MAVSGRRRPMIEIFHKIVRHPKNGGLDEIRSDVRGHFRPKSSTFHADGDGHTRLKVFIGDPKGLFMLKTEK